MKIRSDQLQVGTVMATYEVVVGISRGDKIQHVKLRKPNGRERFASWGVTGSLFVRSVPCPT